MLIAGAKVITCSVCGADRFSAISNTDGGEYLRCGDCGLEVQRSAGPDRERFEREQQRYYGGDSICLSSLFRRMDKDRAYRRLAVIQRHLPSGRLIEVGPGSGEVMRLLMSSGFQVDAVEHSPVLAQGIERTASANVVVGEFEALDMEPARYDAFLSFHVIEHVPDMMAHLRRAADVVRPGGFAFLATPNGESWEHRLLGANSPNYSTAHCRILTADSLGRSLDAAGWELVFAQTPAYADASLRAVTSLYRMLRGRNRSRARGGYTAIAERSGGFLAFSVFRVLSAPLRLLQEALSGGNELLVVARRRRRL